MQNLLFTFFFVITFIYATRHADCKYHMQLLGVKMQLLDKRWLLRRTSLNGLWLHRVYFSHIFYVPTKFWVGKLTLEICFYSLVCIKIKANSLQIKCYRSQKKFFRPNLSTFFFFCFSFVSKLLFYFIHL